MLQVQTEGHFSRDCKHEMFTCNERSGTHVRFSRVDGGPAIKMILDTGCLRTTIKKRTCEARESDCHFKGVQIANEDWINCHLAKVE